MVKLFDTSKLRYYTIVAKTFQKYQKTLIDFYLFGHFKMSHHMITQSFENSQKSVFGRTLRAHIGMVCQSGTKGRLSQ
jgi:regulator of sigma D